MTGDELQSLYAELVKQYPIISIEDPFDQQDFKSYANMTKNIGEQVQVVGDDLLVTNTTRIQMALDS